MTNAVPLVKTSELFQVGIAVANLEHSMKTYSSMLGVASWKVFTVDSSIAKMTYKGKPSQHSFKVGLAMLGPLMLELLQPLEGDGVYQDHLNKHGEGIHHLGHVRVDDLDQAIRTMEAAGFPCLEIGRPLDARAHLWAYIDTSSALGYALELTSGGMDPRLMFAARRQK
jgi:hypothetical protein